MRVFVAGATGAVGDRLVPMLVDAGHKVVAMTRSEAKEASLRAAGAEPALVPDPLDGPSVEHAVRRAEPEAVVHHLTALSGSVNMRKFDQSFALTNRFRTETTRHLLAGARAAGARRFLAQSFGGWPYAHEGGPVKTEDDPLDPAPAKQATDTLAAIREQEELLAGAAELQGIALRCGGFYGPGNAIGKGGEIVEMVAKRRFPIVGDGTGVWSFLHIEDAASATVAALERGAPGVYNVVDDEPAPVSEWLPYLAEVLGAKPPRHLPVWIGRLAVGEFGVRMMNEVRGASNAKAKRELGWQPRYASWREGFRTGLG
jgi:nucleoside-diphosphate-sugar epimerase